MAKFSIAKESIIRWFFFLFLLWTFKWFSRRCHTVNKEKTNLHFNGTRNYIDLSLFDRADTSSHIERKKIGKKTYSIFHLISIFYYHKPIININIWNKKTSKFQICLKFPMIKVCNSFVLIIAIWTVFSSKWCMHVYFFA